jgi:ribosomal protein S18 acetylase RimI-like enzyme
MDFVIRTARPGDFTALGELTTQVYRDLLPPLKEARSYLDRMRDVRSRAGDTELLVAVDRADGEVLGGVSFVRPGSTYANVAGPGEGEFRLLAVAPAAQGRGVGEGLVRACLERAAELGLRRVVMATQPNMLTAHRLYTRLGFVRTPERDMSPLPGVSLWTFALELAAAEPARVQDLS